MPVANILTIDDLFKIQALLEDEGYGDVDLDITMGLKKPSFDRVNEQFYYMNNKEGTPPDVEEVAVNIGNVHFKYVVKEDAAV